MLGEYYDPYTDTSWPSTTQPTVNTSSTDDHGGFDWASFIPQVMKLAPNIISAARGSSYGQAGQYGQQGGGQQGLNLTGQSFLGGGSLGISSSTLLLLGGAVLLIFVMKK